jgi:hypothetical protein
MGVWQGCQQGCQAGAESRTVHRAGRITQATAACRGTTDKRIVLMGRGAGLTAPDDPFRRHGQTIA